MSAIEKPLSGWYPPPSAPPAPYPPQLPYYGPISTSPATAPPPPRFDGPAAPSSYIEPWAPPPRAVVITLPPGGVHAEASPGCCPCRCCAPSFFPHLAVPAALALLVAFILSIVTGSNGGDVFFLGWSDNIKTSYRVTLHGVNTCGDVASDAFCSDFFSDSSYPLTTVVGGPALAALTPQLQATFLGGAGLCVFSLLRLFSRSARCCAGLRRDRCGFGFAGGVALTSAIAAGAGAFVLRRYSAASAAFAAANASSASPPPHLRVLPGAAGLQLIGGYACGWVAVGAHAVAAALLLRVALKARRLAAQEREQGARGEALLAEAGVSVQTY